MQLDYTPFHSYSGAQLAAFTFSDKILEFLTSRNVLAPCFSAENSSSEGFLKKPLQMREGET